MSLHAVVYKKLESLPQNLRGLVRVVDDSGGELEFVSRELELQYPPETLLAADVSLGNTSMIAWLKNAITEKCAGGCELLLKNILYSGSHAGDFIAGHDLAELKREIMGAAFSGSDLDPDLGQFLNSILYLISVAEAEQNSIVFV